MTTSHYGQSYWCVGLPDNAETTFHADRISFDAAGSLIAFGIRGGSEHLNLAFAQGEWMYVYAASEMDGHALAVDHWQEAVKDD